MREPEQRRQFLLQAGQVALAAGAIGLAASAQAETADPPLVDPDTLPPEPVAEIPPPDPLIHALGRASYGITNEMLEDALGLGWEGWLEQQLQPEAIDDRTVEAIIAEILPTIAMDAPELNALEMPQRVVAELRAATILRTLLSPRQLFEVMVEFWSNHFSVYHQDGAVRILKTIEDREVIRAHAMGNFRDLLHASAKSPAMLVYLDNFASTAGSPNENYSRELMELHTLGITGGYTEDDVQAVARAFTGWTVNRRQGTFRFVRRLHDSDEKVVLGEVLPGDQGIEDGEAVLDILAAHPSTASFISRKLAVHFVSDQPSDELVATMAQSFTDSNGDIRQVLYTMLTSDEFFASADKKLKRPYEYAAAMMRQTQATLGRFAMRSVGESLAALGQVPFNWPAPNGYPDVEGYWATTNGLLHRWNLALNASGGQLRDVDIDFRDLVTRPWTASHIVDQLAENVLRRPLAAADRDALIAFLGAGLGPTTALPIDELRERVAQTLALMLSSPYFQRR